MLALPRDRCVEQAGDADAMRQLAFDGCVDEARSQERCRFPMLRQQWEREGQTSFRSLADYIAPVASGKADYRRAASVFERTRGAAQHSTQPEME